MNPGIPLTPARFAMPTPPSDEDMSGFTDLNRESGIWQTDLGDFPLGPGRIERAADGSLIIRPRSEVVNRTPDWFAEMYEERDAEPDWIDRVRRMQSRWGILRDPYELWEVEFAWFADDFLKRPQGNHIFWRTKPIGVISYIDKFDLPIEEHYNRARSIIAAGSDFAIVVNVETAEARVFRLSGVERFTGPFRIPEWPWFEVPVMSGWTDDWA